MGYEIPTPVDRAKTLVARKEFIETELESQLSILKANNSTLNSPLVDQDGFPRADIDIWAIRHARVRVIELRNDLNAVMDEIGKALEGVYAPTVAQTQDDEEPWSELRPFARVNAVAPGSPAATSVRLAYFSVIT
jgi:26S proteasome non-ATPase regulatory subunit 9